MSTQFDIVRLSAASLFLLTTPACGESEFEPGGALELREYPPTPPEAANDLQEAACPPDRQIGRKLSSLRSCPSATGWTAKPIFVPLSPLGAGVLEDYCEYTWDDPLEPPNLDALKTTAGLVDFSSDCEVVFEQGNALATALDPEVEDLFDHAIGRIDATDLGNSQTSRAPVLVVVVDSVPHDAPTDPRSMHGELMVSIINDIACPGGDPLCATTIERSLGLPRYTGAQIDPERGGYFGSQQDIARGIFSSVDKWRSKDWNGQRPKLIINLSVGWEGYFFGDHHPTEQKPAVDQVFDAITFASCLGVLVVASAGNQGHLCTRGPLEPGGWEPYPAPSAARCAELSVVAPAPTSGSYQPLIYSVGGLTHGDEPMPGTRVEGMPRQAASATHAAVTIPLALGGGSTALTGTSVAAASVTGAAALAWSYNPDLTVGQLMNSIHRSGTALPGLNVDYAAAGSDNTEVRKLNVCAALEDVCNRPGASCPAAPFDTPLPCLTAPAPLTLADLFTTIRSLSISPANELVPTFGLSNNCPAVCGLPATGYRDPSSGVVPCPEIIQPTAPYGLPQPTEVACPNCTLDLTTGTIYASIDSSYDKFSITDVTASVTGATDIGYFRMGSLPLSSTFISSITLDPSRIPSDPKSASISITFGGADAPPRPVTDVLLLE